MSERRLMRSTRERKIAGVAGGVAEYFELDPSLVRVAWVVAAIFGGFGLLVYVILWIVLPEGDQVPRPSSAVRIAEERYARGEITAEELARIKADLTS
jgi:phage shock protein PspC (stress-responsive transcriptional regulator)